MSRNETEEVVHSFDDGMLFQKLQEDRLHDQSVTECPMFREIGDLQMLADCLKTMVWKLPKSPSGQIQSVHDRMLGDVLPNPVQGDRQETEIKRRIVSQQDSYLGSRGIERIPVALSRWMADHEACHP